MWRLGLHWAGGSSHPVSACVMCLCIPVSQSSPCWCSGCRAHQNQVCRHQPCGLPTRPWCQPWQRLRPCIWSAHTPMLVSWGFWNKAPQPWWLSITHIYCLTSGDHKSKISCLGWKWRSWQDHSPSESSRGQSILPPFPASRATFVAFLVPSSLPPASWPAMGSKWSILLAAPLTSCRQISPCLPLIRIHVFAFRAYLANLG